MELLQTVEYGDQLDEGPVRWKGADVYPTTVQNRRRLIARARARGFTSQPDGWVYERTVIGSLGLDRVQLAQVGWTENPTLSAWVRIRWDRA